MNEDIGQYYHTLAVIRRILEFIGVPDRRLSGLAGKGASLFSDSAGLKEMLGFSTAEYVAAYGKTLLELTGKDHVALKREDLVWAMDNALDIHRSVWDRENVLGILDVEYFSKNFVAEAYFNPVRIFTMLEGVYRAILEVMNSCGISPLVITTGQGYNFDMLVPKDSSVFRDFAVLGHVEETLRQDYSQPFALTGRPVPEEDGRAFDTMGKLAEFLCHKILVHMQGSLLSIPIVIGDIVCGNERREAVSLDLSLYTHPVHRRSIRCPFSSYSKHRLAADASRNMKFEYGGALFCVPRRMAETELALEEILYTRTSSMRSMQLAREVTTRITSQHEGFACLLDEYRRSALYEFHLEFDEVKQDDISMWQGGYDRFELDSVPPCVAQAFRCPNPLLLQPTNIRTIVGALMAIGWHPKHIAGIIYSKYMRDFSWEVDFRRYNANRWANVWVRIYAGLVACEVDGLLDFNCTSQREKGEAWRGMQYCPSPGCGFNLSDYRPRIKV